MFEMSVRVRLSETDALGMVYYARYYHYFDLSRVELLRTAGLTLRWLRERELQFVCAESFCRYFGSARFDDELVLKVGISRLGSSSVTYFHEVFRGRRRLAEGRVVDVLVDHKGKPAKMPLELRKRLARLPVVHHSPSKES